MSESQYPEYVLALHSSKRLLIEQLNSSNHLLADAIINLTLAKGQRHEGREGMTGYYFTNLVSWLGWFPLRWFPLTWISSMVVSSNMVSTSVVSTNVKGFPLWGFPLRGFPLRGFPLWWFSLRGFPLSSF